MIVDLGYADAGRWTYVRTSFISQTEVTGRETNSDRGLID